MFLKIFLKLREDIIPSVEVTLSRQVTCDAKLCMFQYKLLHNI